MRRSLIAFVGIALVAGSSLGVAFAPSGTRSPHPASTARKKPASGIHKIKHVIVIMQENRSFDHYFGTFPGAYGIPMQHGVPTVCAPDPAAHECVKPFPVHTDNDAGGPHADLAHQQSVDGGRMDGFIRAVESARRLCVDTADPGCDTEANASVMGY